MNKLCFTCSLLLLTLSNAHAQFRLPVSIGETKMEAMGKLQQYKSVIITATMRQADSSDGSRIDSAYEEVHFQGISGRLFIIFAREEQARIIGLHWESAVSYRRAFTILRQLKKHYGGTIETFASPTWWSESTRILREAIIYQHDLAYFESYSSN